MKKNNSPKNSRKGGSRPTSSRHKKLIIGNWKMKPHNSAEAKAIFSAIRKTSSGLSRVKTVICPPFVYISELNRLVKSGQAVVGAQSVFYEESGAFTGEVSAAMLKDSGAQYVIVGHSERRAMGETNEVINKKLIRVVSDGLIAVLCVGEKERDHGGDYLEFVKTQLAECLRGIEKKDLKKIVVAYEPVWAIGKSDKDAMQPGDIHIMSIYVKKVLSDLFDQSAAAPVSILYGGSVTGAISEMIFREGKVDGLLVGRASLDPKDFSLILRQAEAL